jgi:hypothetical protein
MMSMVRNKIKKLGMQKHMMNGKNKKIQIIIHMYVQGLILTSSKKKVSK